MVEKDLAIIEKKEFALPSQDEVRGQLKAIADFQNLVHSSLKQGSDYGKIPGTNKPTLLKPGAEKMAKLLHLHDDYVILNETIDWDRPLFSYTVKCALSVIGSEVTVSSGLGECNSMEGKYRSRWVYKKDIPVGLDESVLVKKEKEGKYGKYFVYKIDNDDVFSQKNTILKMAKKRAMIDAVLSAGRLSEIFTQDVEDTGTEDNGEPGESSQTTTGGNPEPTELPPDKKAIIESIISSNKLNKGKIAWFNNPKIPYQSKIDLAIKEGLYTPTGQSEGNKSQENGVGKCPECGGMMSYVGEEKGVEEYKCMDCGKVIFKEKE